MALTAFYYYNRL